MEHCLESLAAATLLLYCPRATITSHPCTYLRYCYVSVSVLVRRLCLCLYPLLHLSVNFYSLPHLNSLLFSRRIESSLSVKSCLVAPQQTKTSHLM
jgi:hypothetical protein